MNLSKNENSKKNLKSIKSNKVITNTYNSYGTTNDKMNEKRFKLGSRDDNKLEKSTNKGQEVLVPANCHAFYLELW